MNFDHLEGERFFDEGKEGFSDRYLANLEKASPLERTFWNIFMDNVDSPSDSGTTLRDILRGGWDAGIAGLIYSQECMELFEKHEEELYDLLDDLAKRYETDIERMLNFEYEDTHRFDRILSSSDKEAVVYTAFMEYANALDRAGFIEQCETAFSDPEPEGLGR